MDAGILHDEIVKVCPVIRTTVEKSDDRDTWSFEPTPEATNKQIKDGNDVIKTIPVDFVPPPTVPPGAEVLYDHENRLRALEGQPVIEPQAFTAKLPKKPLPRRK